MTEAFLTLDGGILLWLQENVRCGLLNTVLGFYTRLGDAGLLWIALSLGMLAFPRTRKAGFLGLLSMVFGLFVTNLTIKPLIARARPWLVVEGLTHLVEEKDPNSFPSGHTCAAFAAAASWYRALPRRWGVTAVVMAALMGLSRLYVGVHFPSDVLAGMCVGLLCAWAAWLVHSRVRSRLPETLQ